MILCKLSYFVCIKEIYSAVTDMKYTIPHWSNKQTAAYSAKLYPFISSVGKQRIMTAIQDALPLFYHLINYDLRSSIFRNQIGKFISEMI